MVAIQTMLQFSLNVHRIRFSFT